MEAKHPLYILCEQLKVHYSSYEAHEVTAAQKDAILSDYLVWLLSTNPDASDPPVHEAIKLFLAWRAGHRPDRQAWDRVRENLSRAVATLVDGDLEHDGILQDSVTEGQLSILKGYHVAQQAVALATAPSDDIPKHIGKLIDCAETAATREEQRQALAARIPNQRSETLEF